MGSKSTTTKQTNEPPKWAKPLFEQSASEASRLYSSGAGFQPYQGQTLADQSGATQAGQNMLLGAAGIGQDQVGNALTGQSMIKDTYNELGDTASGKYLVDGNPYMRDRLERETADTAALVNSSMSGRGRYGSGANTRVLADSIGAMRGNALEADFNRERGLQMGAIGQRGQLAGNYLDSVGSVNQAAMMPGNMLLGVGQMQDMRAQQEIEDQRARFDAEQNVDWTRLGALQAAAAGAAGPYGTMTNRTTQPMNPMAMLGGLGSFMMGMGPQGMGWFGGQASDIRLKANIEPVGTTAYGLTLYEFNYTGRPERYRGVMAQDVLKVKPEAVGLIGDFYAVDYGMLGIEMERV